MHKINRLVGKIFRPPCPYLCDLPIGRELPERFQATCLTCPKRREKFEKNTHYKRYPKVLIMLESASGKGILVPEHYKAYGLMVDFDSHLYHLKACLLKLIMTLAERIAEW